MNKTQRTARKILRSYRIFSKNHAPRIARAMAYVVNSGGAVQNLFVVNRQRMYKIRYWNGRVQTITRF